MPSQLSQIELEPPHPKTPFRDTCGFLVILLVALGLRIALIDSQSLFIDEVGELEIAQLGWNGILTAENRFPPLFHTLLWLWWQVFPADVTGHFFTIICGTFFVGAVGLLSQAVGGKKAGLWTAGLSAISPLAVWYSADTRVYALYLTLATISLWQFTRAMQTDRTAHWVGFAVASLAGVYTHYYFGLLLAISGLLMLAMRLQFRLQLRRGITTFSLIALLSLPDILFFQQDMDQSWGFARTSQFSLAAFAYTFFSYFSGYSLGPSLRALHEISPSAALKQVAPWAILLGLPVAILLINGIRSLPTKRGTNWWLLTLALGILPVLLVGLLSRQASFGYNPRHVLWCYTPLLVTVSLGIVWGKPRWLMRICAGLLISISIFAIYQHATNDAHRTEDSRLVAQYVLQDPAGEIPFFVLSGYMQRPLQYYLPQERPIIGLFEGEVGLTADAAIKQINVFQDEHQIFWFAYTRPFHGDPKGEILDRLQREYQLKLAQTFAGYQLYQGYYR